MDQVIHVACDQLVNSTAITDILSTCGKIRALYPFKCETSPGDTHFFVHFFDSASTQRALKANFSGFHVYSISNDPSAAEAFYKASENSRNNLQNLPIFAKRSCDKRVGTRPKPSRYNYDITSSSTDNDPLILRILKTPISCPQPPKLVEDLPCKDTSPPSQLHSFSPTLVSSQSSFGPQYSMETSVSMILCGESFSYNLSRSLEDDPSGIITLLKATNSEHGTWMIVGAHYRRVGNPSAAIKVISAMIDVMITHSPDIDMKPAFLLLSGCELDLSKTGGTTAADHHKNAVKWLQKVYGSLEPIKTTAKPVMTVSPSVPVGLPAKPRGQPYSTPREPSTQAIPLRRPSSPSPSPPKRKLEDDLNFERETRRKLEKELAAMTKERDHARKMESFAQEQVKREVESRKRAEERAERERERRINTEKDSNRRIAFS